jgi:quinol-cytochrome oxidoreductase complex cytochrome b subunit
MFIPPAQSTTGFSIAIAILVIVCVIALFVWGHKDVYAAAGFFAALVMAVISMIAFDLED